MTEERFTAADLEPSDDDRRAVFRAHADRAAAAVAVLAAGVWVGGMVALGACAAPFVFRLTPAPFSGDAMGAAFARFDQIAIGCAVVLLAAEVARTWAARGRARLVPARVRRLLAVAMAGCAAYIGLVLTPAINEMHRQGVQRFVGEAGAALEAIHHRAEAIGKVEALLGVAVVFLHVFTIAHRRPEDEEEESYATPLPPGPRE